MGLSKADEFKALPLGEKKHRLSLLTNKQAEALLYDWDYWSRPEQRHPDGDWDVWVALAGRGFGKTRAGAEWTREEVKRKPIVNLIGPTAADVRDVMVEGESGIMTICPPGERPIYLPSKGRLVWPNGAISKLFSADEPERLRGPQAYDYWADELCAWRYLEETFDMMMFGLRLGDHPHLFVTTTPKVGKILRAILKHEYGTCVVTRGGTVDNRGNLSERFIKRIYNKFGGTRLGRQELNGEVLDDNPNALFQRKNIDAFRIKPDEMPELVRIVIPVDPAVTAKEDSDDTGIVPVGMDSRYPPHFYVLDDLTCHESPDGWAKVVVEAYKKWKADRVVGEVNNGGDLVESNIRHQDINIPFQAVHASRGKIVRAEPISALYEQGRVHHVGHFADLEDQMCDFDPLTTDKSPDRMDSLVWGITMLAGNDEVETVVEHQEEVHIDDMLDNADGIEFSNW